MKAIICTKYGPPEGLKLREVEKPIPGDDEVLIRVHAASLNQYDWHMTTADIIAVRLMGCGFFKPKKDQVGTDLAGVVEAAGKNISHFKPGDAVYGDISHSRSGSLAEYACATEDMIALKPANLTFEKAAAVPMAGLTALQGLRDKGRIAKGQKVLIQGAAGGVGTFAVQIAKAYGAEVTAVCSTRNIEQARAMGADHVIDYTKEDFTKNGEQYDLIMGVNGYHPIQDYRRALKPGGVYVMAGGSGRQILQGVTAGRRRDESDGRVLTSFTAKADTKDLAVLKELIEAGKVNPVVDKCYTLDESAAALRYLGGKHARGKVVVKIIDN